MSQVTEQFSAERNNTENAPRERIAERLIAGALELRAQSSFLLGDDKAHAERLAIPMEMLSALSPDDRTRAAETFGRLSFIFGNNQNFEKWAEKVDDECAELKERASDVTLITPVVDKLIAQAQFEMARQINTNSSGALYRFRPVMRDQFVSTLKSAGDEEATGEVFNPFHLAPGTVIYKSARNAEGRLVLNEVVLDDVILDGNDSAVDIGGDTVPLSDLNHELVSGWSMLRDGSNVRGALKENMVMPEFAIGEQIKLVYRPTSDKEDNSSVGEYLGSNEDELRERYGNAYLPFRKQLVVLNVRFDDKEVAVPLTEATPQKIGA